jgi:AraC-like DNA-binding protein
VLSDPTLAVMYHAGQPYRRGLASSEGDACSFIGLSRELASEAAAGLDPAADDPDTYRFPFSAAPVGRAVHALHQQMRARAGQQIVDIDAWREALYWSVAQVVASGYGSAATPNRRRAATAELHAEAVDGVRALVTVDLAARLSLDDLAAVVHLSPFHLSRVFREVTGTSIHAYRTEVRLRASLDRIAAGGELADIAAELGFASHAHLTDRFKRAYGMSPQAWRQGLRGRAELSRIMEAGGVTARIA